MDSCGNVRMDRYWNFVALPFFVVTLLFGLFALFTVDEQQFASTKVVQASVAELRGIVGTTPPVKVSP
jgi:hypothetical protein